MLNYAAHGNAGSVKYQTSASLFILYRPYKGHFKFRSNPTVTTILPFSEGTWNGLFHDPLANFQKYPYTCISFFLFLKHINYFVLVFYWRRVFSGDFLVPLKKTQKWIITKINWNISLTHSVIYFFDYIHFCTLIEVFNLSLKKFVRKTLSTLETLRRSCKHRWFLNPVIALQSRPRAKYVLWGRGWVGARGCKYDVHFV